MASASTPGPSCQPQKGGDGGSPLGFGFGGRFYFIEAHVASSTLRIHWFILCPVCVMDRTIRNPASVSEALAGTPSRRVSCARQAVSGELNNRGESVTSGHLEVTPTDAQERSCFFRPDFT